MPEMDGFEATAAIRQEEGSTHIPIVAMTAHAMKGDRERCLAAGMDAYVTKPLQARRLIQVIEACSRLPPERKRRGAGCGADRVQFDREAALVRVGGDLGLLREIAGLFFGEAPRLLSDIRGRSRAVTRTRWSAPRTR